MLLFYRNLTAQKVIYSNMLMAQRLGVFKKQFTKKRKKMFTVPFLVFWIFNNTFQTSETMKSSVCVTDNFSPQLLHNEKKESLTNKRKLFWCCCPSLSNTGILKLPISIYSTPILLCWRGLSGPPLRPCWPPLNPSYGVCQAAPGPGRHFQKPID